MSNPVLYIDSPLLTFEKYAEKIGVTADSVRSKASLGHLPTVKQGRHRFVNYAAIVRAAWEAGRSENA